MVLFFQKSRKIELYNMPRTCEDTSISLAMHVGFSCLPFRFLENFLYWKIFCTHKAIVLTKAEFSGLRLAILFDQIHLNYHY